MTKTPHHLRLKVATVADVNEKSVAQYERDASRMRARTVARIEEAAAALGIQLVRGACEVR